jgi:hypothetical protein
MEQSQGPTLLTCTYNPRTPPRSLGMRIGRNALAILTRTRTLEDGVPPVLVCIQNLCRHDEGGT